jgi:hypothetical protein
MDCANKMAQAEAIYHRRVLGHVPNPKEFIS